MDAIDGLVTTAADGLLTDQMQEFWMIRTRSTAGLVRGLSNAYFASAKQVAQIIINEAWNALLFPGEIPSLSMYSSVDSPSK